jgi:hypothetical protein
VSTGWATRLAILHRDAEDKILAPLRVHNWTLHGVREFEHGEYLIIDAERGGQRHKISLLYTSGTANAVYRKLSGEVEHIFINGELYKLESFAYGIETPISPADDFHNVLVEWNAASSPGKFAPGAPVELTPSAPPAHQRLLSETPIEAVWLRLRQLSSVSLARKAVETRARSAGVRLDASAVENKAVGLAYSLRNATDYFHARDVRNVSQRVLNLYYGTLGFAFAEMLAAPDGSKALSEIEDSTKQGHGLYTVDGSTDSLEHLVVGVIASGFFPSWMKSLGSDVSSFPT